MSKIRGNGNRPFGGCRRGPQDGTGPRGGTPACPKTPKK